MAIYKIFSEKDTFIYSEVPLGNAGKDEVLGVGGYPVNGIGHASRILLQFATTEIQDVINNYIISGSFKAYLGLYLCDAYQVPVSSSIYIYPLSGSWDNGTGKYGDLVVDHTGVCWNYKLLDSTGPWTSYSGGTYSTGVTGSYISSYPGGGDWYYEYDGSSVELSQTFPFNSNHDIYTDIVDIVKLHYSGSISNSGLLLKLPDNLEFITGSSSILKYYGGDTNTIFPPYLEFKWDDSYYSSSLAAVNESSAFIGIKNNRRGYLNEGKQRFRLKVRPKYPTRQFTTSSMYLTNYILPQDSYWGLKDEYTGEIIVDFDTSYTKISADNSGSYFDVYMGGLEPERYYRPLIKSTLDGSTVVVEGDSFFKVVRKWGAV